MLPSAKNAAEQELRTNFRPEFLNRFDEIITFKPLSKENIRDIAKIMVGKLQHNLEAEQGIRISLTDKAYDYIVDKGYDPANGARPLRRAIQNDLETLLSYSLIGGTIKKGDYAVIDIGADGKLFVEKGKESEIQTPVIDDFEQNTSDLEQDDIKQEPSEENVEFDEFPD